MRFRLAQSSAREYEQEKDKLRESFHKIFLWFKEEKD